MRSASAVNSRQWQLAIARAHQATNARARPSAWVLNSRRVTARDNSRPWQLASLVLIEKIAHVRGGGCKGAAGTLPPPLTNAAERGTIEIEKESLPVRRLARFIYYLEKVADSLAGRLLFHAFEQFHHQCNDDSEYHQHNGEQLKITQEVTLPSTRLPIGGYVNRKFRLPGKGQPPENSVQAVLPVGRASSLLCTVSWQTPAWYPMQF